MDENHNIEDSSFRPRNTAQNMATTSRLQNSTNQQTAAKKEKSNA